MKQQDSLHEEEFRSENPDTEDHSLKEPSCGCSPGTGPLQMAPNHRWYSHIGHRRRHRVLRLLTRKSIR